MATPGEKLAESLEVVKRLQDKGVVAINTKDISRVHRERLVEKGFLKEAMKGWYLAVPADEKKGDSSSWYASYWAFCAGYLKKRYENSYCISAEQSLQLHAGDNTVPQQLIVRSVKGPNGVTPMLNKTSLFTMKSPLPKAAEIQVVEGLRMLTLPSSLIHCTSSMFTLNATDMRTALTLIKDASEILVLLLEGGHSTIAGRLAGAFRNVGREKIANEILKTMQSAGYDVRETDPFETKTPIPLSSREKSPYVNRIKLMWESMRGVIIENFPQAPGIPKNHEKYMKLVEEIYVTDAYHSLSIESYRVTPELIERVRSGQWNIIKNAEDKNQRDAMAARGYWQATQKVRESIKKILQGGNPGKVVDDDHGDWYRELFAPSVTSGIIKASDLAGYRSGQVYISQSKHVPLNASAVRDAMPVFFELLQNEQEASVRAVLGHFIFVFIHPYMDGNGRMGRFLMNVMLASGGYPWTVIPVEERKAYMEALEKASAELEIETLSKFIGALVNEGIKEMPVAAVPIKPEFPPYSFYQNSTGVKEEIRAIQVNEKFKTLRLFNVSISPIEEKPGITLEIIIDNGTRKKTHRYELTDLFYNPNLPNHLFFIDNKNKHKDLALPAGRKWITFKVHYPSRKKKFEILLACEYL